MSELALYRIMYAAGLAQHALNAALLIGFQLAFSRGHRLLNPPDPELERSEAYLAGTAWRRP